MAGQPVVPHILSSFAHRYIASVTSDSIFLVRARAIDDVYPDRRGRQALQRLLHHDEVYRSIGNISSASSSEHADSPEPLDDTWTSNDIRTATGFAVRRNGGRMLILTAAHIIRPVFAHRSIVTNDCTDLNMAFRFDVMCVHQERNLLNTATVDQNIGAMERIFTLASVVAMDSDLDLLALQVTEDELCIFNQGQYLPCLRHDRVIPVDDRTAPDSEEVLLQSWPELRSDSTYWTRSSYPERRYHTLTSSNPYHYRMRLLELPGVKCPDGCSGGPVVNDSLCAVGVYHGVLGNYGYAISSRDIRNFLQRYHLDGSGVQG